MKSNTPETFWARVKKSTYCWMWLGTKHNKGYGVFHLSGKPRKAHRVAWELAYGPIPDGLWVLHTCDVPACVRPEHLFLGTNKDNMQDMAAKGRGVFQKHPEKVQRGDAHFSRRRKELVKRGAQHYLHNHPERNPNAKLTWVEVMDIRALYRLGGTTLTKLAKRYGVSHVAIGDIVANRSWNVELQEGVLEAEYREVD